MANLFIDCNPTIQDCSLAYFQRMKQQGAKGAFIKLSEGQTWTTHTKGKSWEQAYNNSVQAGLMTGLYHFQRFTNTAVAVKEAQFFCRQLDSGKISKQVKLMLDAEVAGASTTTCAAFLQEMIRQGRGQLATYTYKNFWQIVMDSHQLNAYGKIWLAGYKISSLGIDNVDAWQTADTWNGVSQDINTDYTADQWFTTNSTSQTTVAQSAAVVKPVPTSTTASTFVDALGVTWYKQTGTFTTDRAINLRWGATTGSSLIATIKAGQSINYDQYAYSGGYVWIRQPRGTGQYGYMATGQFNGIKRINTWGKFV